MNAIKVFFWFEAFDHSSVCTPVDCLSTSISRAHRNEDTKMPIKIIHHNTPSFIFKGQMKLLTIASFPVA